MSDSSDSSARNKRLKNQRKQKILQNNTREQKEGSKEFQEEKKESNFNLIENNEIENNNFINNNKPNKMGNQYSSRSMISHLNKETNLSNRNSSHHNVDDSNLEDSPKNNNQEVRVHNEDIILETNKNTKNYEKEGIRNEQENKINEMEIITNENNKPKLKQNNVVNLISDEESIADACVNELKQNVNERNKIIKNKNSSKDKLIINLIDNDEHIDNDINNNKNSNKNNSNTNNHIYNTDNKAYIHKERIFKIPYRYKKHQDLLEKIKSYFNILSIKEIIYTIENAIKSNYIIHELFNNLSQQASIKLVIKISNGELNVESSMDTTMQILEKQMNNNHMHLDYFDKNIESCVISEYNSIVFDYLPIKCKKTNCNKYNDSTESCIYSHTIEEINFHPLVYKTNICSDLFKNKCVYNTKFVTKYEKVINNNEDNFNKSIDNEECKRIFRNVEMNTNSSMRNEVDSYCYCSKSHSLDSDFRLIYDYKNEKLRIIINEFYESDLGKLLKNYMDYYNVDNSLNCIDLNTYKVALCSRNMCHINKDNKNFNLIDVHKKLCKVNKIKDLVDKDENTKELKLKIDSHKLFCNGNADQTIYEYNILKMKNAIDSSKFNKVLGSNIVDIENKNDINKERRRPPRLFRYSSNICENFAKNKCSSGEFCINSHTINEVKYHEDNYFKKFQAQSDIKRCPDYSFLDKDNPKASSSCVFYRSCDKSHNANYYSYVFDSFRCNCCGLFLNEKKCYYISKCKHILCEKGFIEMIRNMNLYDKIESLVLNSDATRIFNDASSSKCFDCSVCFSLAKKSEIFEIQLR